MERKGRKKNRTKAVVIITGYVHVKTKWTKKTREQIKDEKQMDKRKKNEIKR